eukprot:jgi/Phyca11/103198/e_gw1.7.598.1
MPARSEGNQLKALLDELKAFESSSKKLQSADGLSLLDVRDIFDALIVDHPRVENYLAADAAIVQQPAQVVEEEELSFADKALTKRKLQCEQLSEYPEIVMIHHTSNACERFFSQTKCVLEGHRQGLLPIHLEMVLFLKIYRKI